MYNYKLKFTIKPEADGLEDEAVLEMLDSYWNALRKNGQVIDGFDIFADNSHFYLTVVLPEEDSLSDSNCNAYARERFQKLNALFEVELIRDGINLETPYSCTCEKPSGFCLDGDVYNNATPLICEDCCQPVPLYKVPYVFDDFLEHTSILRWQLAYMRIHGLWVHGSWDRFTYGELSKHNSKLNREGREICKALEKILGVPVYYELFCFDEKEGDEFSVIPRGFPKGLPKACPQCGEAWGDEGEFFRCEKCRLRVFNFEFCRASKG